VNAAGVSVKLGETRHAIHPICGPVAQLVEHVTFNHRVAGSSPARLTSFIINNLQGIVDSKLAGVRTVNPHRFRDTLAIDLLDQKVPIEDVKDVLGHEDVNITLKHYGNWVKARQDRLTRSLKKIYEIA
jgi:integrase